MRTLFRSSSRSANPARRCPTILHKHSFSSSSATTPRKVLIMGAAGRDFHNFNMKFRNNSAYDVKAFTATQIPGIEDRRYPPELSGAKLYPTGIPIHDETELASLIAKHQIDDVVFAYSDVSNDYIMHCASKVMALGPNFMVLGKSETQLESNKPCISVVASRTGCGKSQTSRYVVEALRKQDLTVVAMRHPMPYGTNLNDQTVQRYATVEDLVKYECTIEEREEYEPYVQRGCVIYSGVDYQQILSEAEKEADVILWDGGNNDMSFIKADIEITVVDPHRAGHEISYYPGQTNVLTADIVIINKVDSAPMENIMQLRDTIERLNPTAIIIEAASPITVAAESVDMIRHKRVLVVEDGPTLTHGGMTFGAGMVAAKKFGAKTMVDPRPYIVGSMNDTFESYPNIGCLLPAMGYGDGQIRDLEATINRMIELDVIDIVISGTPIDLSQIINVNAPVIRANYDLQCIGEPKLEEVIQQKLKLKLGRGLNNTK